MASFISAAERALIKGCAEQGVGIEGLPGAPGFRFVPAGDMAGQEVEHCARSHYGQKYSQPVQHEGKPSNRGSIRGTVAKGFPKLKNWTVPSYSLAPQYNTPMRGDSAELTDARRSWHNGNAGPLREYLLEQKLNR